MFEPLNPFFHPLINLLDYIIPLLTRSPLFNLHLLNRQLETPYPLNTHLILLLHDLDLPLHVPHRILLVLHLQLQLTHAHALPLQLLLQLPAQLLVLPPRLGLPVQRPDRLLLVTQLALKV